MHIENNIQSLIDTKRDKAFFITIVNNFYEATLYSQMLSKEIL